MNILFEAIELTYQESKKAVDDYLLPLQVLSQKLQTSFDHVDGLVVADDLIKKLTQISNVSNKETLERVRLESLIDHVELFLLSINELEALDIVILYGVIFHSKSDTALASELSSSNEEISRSRINRRKQAAFKRLWYIIEFNKLLQAV